MDVAEEVVVDPLRRSSGIAGTEMLKGPDGERLVYSGTDRGVVAGRPANIGERTPSGIAGTEFLIDENGNRVLVYMGTVNPVVAGTPAPVSEEGEEDSGVSNGNNPAGTGTFVASDGAEFTDRNAFNLYQQRIDELAGVRSAAQASRKSAFDILRDEFKRYGLESLITDSEALARSGVDPEEFSIGLRNTQAYKQRFSANTARINAGLSALSPAEYVALEDQYQRLMRTYGLPASFYQKTGTGSQPELDKLISVDVAPTELEERIQLAVEKVNNASPEVIQSLEEFYPGVNKANLVAYVLDPQKALPLIQRQVRAAEIGAGARQAGLGTTVGRAEELARYGVTAERAREGFQTVAETLPRGGQLASFYKEAPLTQSEVESEVFGTTGAVEAKKRRERLVGREVASFAGSSGAAQGALARERAGSF